MIYSEGFQSDTPTGLARLINDYFETDFESDDEQFEIISCNYQAFQTNNYADHIYSAIIIYKTKLL